MGKGKTKTLKKIFKNLLFLQILVFFFMEAFHNITLLGNFILAEETEPILPITMYLIDYIPSMMLSAADTWTNTDQ